MRFPTQILTKNNTPVPSLIVVCGATATGKTSLAIALAQRLSSIILSADSRQIYRNFDIGTAKPTLAERQGIPHYLIDIADPIHTLTLADYQQQAQTLIHQFQPTAVPLLVGGTGLYIKAIVKGMQIPRVPPQPTLRAHLQALGQPQCYAILQQVDSIAAAKIHAHDQVRTLRALEVFYTTGCPLSAQQGELPPNYPILQIGLDSVNVEQLRCRIEHRTAQMVEAGFVAEVARLRQQYGDTLPLLQTLGYAEFQQYLAGECSLAEAISATVLHTRQFAKRQRTWFRADPTIVWFDCDRPDLLDAVWQQVCEFLTQHLGQSSQN
jgi:tRNA dimethylallyltransferase